LDEQNGEFPIKSVRKAMAILDALSNARRPLRVIDLSNQLKMSVSAVSRLVTTLSSGGLVYQDEDTDRCYLGLGLTVLGSDALGRRELDRIAMPVLDELAHRTSCYVSLSRFMEAEPSSCARGRFDLAAPPLFLTQRRHSPVIAVGTCRGIQGAIKPRRAGRNRTRSRRDLRIRCRDRLDSTCPI
jgi:DNA-binding transcriptional ArsR family regulator